MDDLIDLIGSSKKDLLKFCNQSASTNNGNDRQIRREHEEVNNSILTKSMKEWSNTVENINNGELKTTKKIGIVKQNEKDLWQSRKEAVSDNQDSVGNDIMNILYASSLSKTQPEDKYLDEVSRLQGERSKRMHHEAMIAKSRMVRKIKSKGFHRHSVRRNLKEYLNNEEKNPNSLRDKLESFEKLRAEERMSLKHKTGGKFAKLQKLRAKYDVNAREALDEMRRRGEELTRKTNNDHDEEEEDEDEDEEEEEIKDMDLDDDEEEMDENVEMMASSSGARLLENSKSHLARSFVEKNCKTDKAKTKTVDATLSTDQSKMLSYNADLAGEEDAMNSNERFQQAVLEVYSQDAELAAEFEREKNALAAAEAPKDVDLFQPGWGSWTGPGFETADKNRRRRMRVNAPKAARQDEQKTRVWIKETIPDTMKNHLIKSIPYPYNTAEQFNLSRQELVSASFNPQTVHRQIIKPKFYNRAGHFIYPLEKNEKRANE